MRTGARRRRSVAATMSTAGAPATDPQELLRSRKYVGILVLAALIGVPVSMAAYGFLALVDTLQDGLFTDLPKTLGLDPVPAWWPLPLLTVAGLLVAPAIPRLPGNGGHSPADGFKPSGPVDPAHLPSIVL